MKLDRRSFARGGMATLAFAGLGAPAAARQSSRAVDFGPLRPDPRGLIDLPEGFRYSVISSFGDAMDDGYWVPDKFDGMACIGLGGSRVALIRNHELKPADRERGPTRGRPDLDRKLLSEPHFGLDRDGRVLPAGTTTIVYNLRSAKREREFLSLAGTAVNCGGGETPWGSWLTCEESVLGQPEVGQRHGWVFEVPKLDRSAARPIRALGRFRHEALAIDRRNGIIYLTEDRDDGLFYRFIPNDRRRPEVGGRLQALAIVGADGGDTRNWTSRLIAPHQTVATRWIDLTQIESPDDDLRQRGRLLGAAIFARGEGIHFGRGELYFTCTSGGAAKIGQIMRYVPSSREGQADEARFPASLQLFLESQDSTLFDYGDNLTVAPWGDLIVCEDRADDVFNHLRRVTPTGQVSSFGRLTVKTELAGACFSPDGQTLFVNVYSPGRTLAITGDWRRTGRRRG